MIPALIEKFLQAKPELEKFFAAKQPEGYLEILTETVRLIDDYSLDVDRIHQIDDGNYQGTLLFVIADRGYQPTDYIATRVNYGSCSGCDTLEAIRQYDDAPPTEQQIADYMTLALHMVENMRPMFD